MTLALPIPGIGWGPYPERPTTDTSFGARVLRAIATQYSHSARRERQRSLRMVPLVHGIAPALATLNDEALGQRIRETRAALARDGFTDALTATAFAIVRELTWRHLGLRQFDTQLIAATILLGNQLAEMATGEGKTLASALAIGTAAMAGIPVHAITANQYLARRDAVALTPIYVALGLNVGIVTDDMSRAARRTAYACDIVYSTAKEIVFDYLRDRLTMRQRASELHRRLHSLDDDGTVPVMRGLCMAVIDEADCVLLDEARTPFILSRARRNADEIQFRTQALALARALSPKQDYEIDGASRTAALLSRGEARLRELTVNLTGQWSDAARREEAVTLALTAINALERDRDYLVQDDQILMIDALTGRIAEGRKWSNGLHQLLELKEGCTPSGDQEVIARITYQRFFPRYHRLCGMSGTLTEARGELRARYGLRCMLVPLRMPARRHALQRRIFITADAQWTAVIERCRVLVAAGRPVLIGTDSVADSEQLSARLAAVNIDHAVLNARHDATEAAIIACAGSGGQITVATNMAGRGTDIPLAAGVAERGGLHVILCQFNASKRIDRQLAGRCARQGEPGSTEAILSLGNALLARYTPPLVIGLLQTYGKRYGLAARPLPGVLAWFIALLPQRIEEIRHRHERARLLHGDSLSDRRLALAGPAE
jgi:preprotein translocase subunit SecA